MPHLVFDDLRPHSWVGDQGVETVAKDTDSVDMYTVDWSGDLHEGETVSTSTWTYAGVRSSAAATITTTSATTTLSGTCGDAKNTVTTSAGRTLVHHLRFVPVLD